MEEVKREVTDGHECMCKKSKNSCCGGTHRFCFKGCCLLRAVFMIALIGITFAIGYGAGNYGERGGRNEHGRHYMMMGSGGWGYKSNNENHQYQRMPVNMRVITNPTTTGVIVGTTSSAGVK